MVQLETEAIKDHPVVVKDVEMTEKEKEVETE